MTNTIESVCAPICEAVEHHTLFSAIHGADFSQPGARAAYDHHRDARAKLRDALRSLYGSDAGQAFFDFANAKGNARAEAQLASSR